MERDTKGIAPQSLYFFQSIIEIAGIFTALSYENGKQ